MPHVVPKLRDDLDSRLPSPRGDSLRVVRADLHRTALQEQGTDPVVVAEDGGQQRILPIRIARVQRRPCLRSDDCGRVVRHRRIVKPEALQFLETGGQISPGGEADPAGRHADTPLPSGKQRGERQAPACGVAANKHGACLARPIGPVGPDVFESRDRIIDRGREHVLGSQAIVQAQRHASCRTADVRHQPTVRLD